MSLKRTGSGSSSFSVENDHIFTDETERDLYFTTNPLELKSDIYCSSNGVLYKYNGSSWSDVSAVIKGEKGEDGEVLSEDVTSALDVRILNLEGSEHEHSNKSILDSITAVFTTEFETKLSNLTDRFKGVFEDSTTRDVGLTTPVNGDYCKQTDTNSFWFYGSGAWIDTGSSSTGDMLASIYDPQGVASDSFSMSNMTEGADALILTTEERTLIAEVDEKQERIGDVLGLQTLNIYDANGDSVASVEGVESDLGDAASAAETLIIRLGTTTDLAIKDGVSDMIRLDNGSRNLLLSASISPPENNSLNLTLGASGRPWVSVTAEGYEYHPPTGSPIPMPLCIGVMAINTAGGIRYRSSDEIYATRDSTGSYDFNVTGEMSQALSDADYFWYTVSGFDGDNLYSTDSWETTGCNVYSRDLSSNTTWSPQDAEITIQVWIMPSS